MGLKQVGKATDAGLRKVASAIGRGDGGDRNGAGIKTAGIICECNPFHAGHRYLMDQARRAGAEAIICLMSGCFTQRGEAAILDPRTRAELLLAGGADAVFELPFPYACGGAEYFAGAGISVLERLGVQSVWFGSECGDLQTLRRAAQAASSETFAERYRAYCRVGTGGTAQAYFECLHELSGIREAFSPNDILGIAYLKAMEQRCSGMEAHTVRRLGSGFREETLRDGELPSASALRRLLRSGGAETWLPWMPADTVRLVEERIRQGLAPADTELAARAFLASLRLMPPQALEAAPELSGGLGRRIAEATHRSGSLDELLSLSVHKKHPQARVRRGILLALTGVTRQDLRQEPAYAVLLAANQTGCRFLAEQRRCRTIPVVTSHAGIPRSDFAARQEALTKAAFSLYTLCLPKPLPSDAFLHCSSLIVN